MSESNVLALNALEWNAQEIPASDCLAQVPIAMESIALVNSVRE